MKDKISRRLESIKAAHESEKTISSRVEDYLEVISEYKSERLEADSLIIRKRSICSLRGSAIIDILKNIVNSQ